MNRLLSYGLLGAATGLRSMAAPAQLSRRVRRTPATRRTGPVMELLARDSTRHLLRLAALGEMIVDKLPSTPDRIDRGPLLGRAVLGALAGGALARLDRRSGALGALLGGAAAVASAYAGYHARRALVRETGLPDMPVALCEDLVAIAIARRAVRG